ncbi:hypothetical protein A3746_04370 [Oleibacter sp. HI0075]|nr:hypothetical protein A3746_22055 [Oleibacter sp. HI0075]KZZ00621.1 hypothetical protein A3746_04370 [Oleibacter sp. HI0075]
MKSIPDTIRDLFQIDLASENKFLKDKANSFRRNKLLKVVEEERVQRKSVHLAPGQDIVLFNALLLDAVFSDPKYVKKIFEKPETRKDATQKLKSLLMERNTVTGIALSSDQTGAMISALEGELDLYTEKLPNPFATLPQVVLGQHTNLLNALLVQASVLDPLDSVLAAYVEGDIDRACELADQLSDQSAVGPFIGLIRKQQVEVKRFKTLLDDFF